MPEYQIVGTKVVVRPFELQDITGQYLQWLNDKNLMRYSRQQWRVHTHESSEAYLAAHVPPDRMWNIVSHRGDQVGTMTTYTNGSTGSWGIMIGHGEQGYGTDAVGAAFAYLLDLQKLNRVVIGTHKDNLALQKIAKRWQMRLTEIGETYRYELTQEEWRSQCCIDYVLSVIP